MGVKIPGATFEPMTSPIVPEDVSPPARYVELNDFRSILAAITAARLEWLNAMSRPQTDEAMRFWFANRDRGTILYALMSEWFRGYWPYRSELRAAVPSVSESSLARCLKEAVGGYYIEIESAGTDGRRRLIKPTRKLIVAVERALTDHFRISAKAMPEDSSFRRGLEYLVNSSERLEEIRSLQAVMRYGAPGRSSPYRDGPE